MVVDLYRPTFNPEATDAHDLFAAKDFAVVWGVVAVLFAAFASQLDNLIQAVNILGSIFYGPMLGIFLVGFFLPLVRATPAFIATVLAQALVMAVFMKSDIGVLELIRFCGQHCLLQRLSLSWAVHEIGSTSVTDGFRRQTHQRKCSINAGR